MHARPNDLYLAYRHEVVLRRLEGADKMDGAMRPYKARLEKELQEKANGARSAP